MTQLIHISLLMVAITTINIVVVVVAQTPLILDRFEVPQSTLSLSTSGTVSNYNCGSSSGLAGGIRKVSLTAPSGTNVGFAAQVGVFIPTGASTAPYGVASTNNNLQSPSFQVLYRLDGGSNSCSSGTNVESSSSISKSTKNLNINLDMIKATGVEFNALAGSTATSVSIILYSSTGSVMAQSQTIKVSSTSATKSFNMYSIPFSDTSKWTSSSSFSGTVGAIELLWQISSNTHFAINLLQLSTGSFTSVSATVFIDCGCNGYQAGTDTLQPGVAVALVISGSGSTCTGTFTQTTGSSGTVTFTSIPSGCTYTLSPMVTSSTLCSNSPSVLTVPAGGSANFALVGTIGTLTIPLDRTVTCGSDTSPAATGFAIVGGSCSGTTGSAIYADAATAITCTAPGATVLIIYRTWSTSGLPSQTQTITVKDSGTISMQGVPPSTTITCNQSLQPAQVNAISCTPATVTTIDSTSASTCDTATCTTSSSTIRTYTAIDQCGNAATSTQTIVRTGCAPSCPPPPPPPPPNTVPPSPSQYPSNINCRFVCDDDDTKFLWF